MDGRFFENPWRPGMIRGGDPFYRYRKHNSTPKVVRIPVHFVRSEKELDRSGCALRIQKVYRGFRVRKSVKRIREMEYEIEAVEKRFQLADLKDSKERVRMNETLMSLLLKLDAIIGMDFGVRVLRKAVIRKAVALQERIDSMVLDSGDNDAQVAQGTEPASAVVARAAALCENAEEPISCILASTENYHESSMDVTEAADSEVNGGEIEPGTTSASALIARAAAVCENAGEPISCVETSITEDAIVHHESSMDEMPAVKPEVNGGNIAPGTEAEYTTVVRAGGEPVSCIESSMEDTFDRDELSIHGKIAVDGGAASTAEDKDSKESVKLLKRMGEENSKMLKMMQHLCESNEAQARLLNVLNQRVVNLEKVFVSDLVRRKKKKKKVATGCVSCT